MLIIHDRVKNGFATMSLPKGSQEYGLPLEEKKTPINKLLACVLFMVLILFSMSIVTQTIAHQLGYPSFLGGFNGFYYPWAWLSWEGQLGARYADTVKVAESYGFLFFTVGFVVFATIMMLMQGKAKAHQFLHGSARWATVKEIEQMGVLAKGGVFVGGFWDKAKKQLRYLVHNGAEHILAFAPTRSGKGVGLVIPTLLGWRHSTVVLDIKGENYALTAGWRRKYLKHACLRFDLSSLSNSVKFNPLEEIRFGTDYEVGDAQNLALMIADPYGTGFKNHWDRQAYALITGLILFDLHEADASGQTANLPRVANLLSDPKRSEEALFVAMFNCTHPVVASTGRDMLDKPEEERGSVVSTAKGHLVLYKDPIVVRNIAHSEFTLSDLMNHDKPVDLYLVLNPKDKQRLMPIIRILIAQIVSVLCPELQFDSGRPKENFKHRLLLLLDEFPALGKIEVIENALGFLAGYGIKAYLICQDLEQLLNAYGEKENITSNVHIQSVYAPNKPRTAKYISDACGVTTVVKKSISFSGNRLGLFLKNTNQNLQEVRRELLTPDEVRRLPAPQKDGNKIVKAGDMLVFVAGHPPIYGRQILYFLDPVFSERVKVDAGSTDIIREIDFTDLVDINLDAVDKEEPASDNAPTPLTDSEGGSKIKKKIKR